MLSSGRPALVVPHRWPADSRRAGSRRVGCEPGGCARGERRLPVLGAATSVLVVSINPKSTPLGHGELPGADIALHLARHNIEVEVRSVERDPRDAGEALLSFAAERGCDLLVMGAYAHSRMRELVLGGATRRSSRKCPCRPDGALISRAAIRGPPSHPAEVESFASETKLREAFFKEIDEQRRPEEIVGRVILAHVAHPSELAGSASAEVSMLLRCRSKHSRGRRAPNHDRQKRGVHRGRSLASGAVGGRARSLSAVTVTLARPQAPPGVSSREVVPRRRGGGEIRSTVFINRRPLPPSF